MAGTMLEVVTSKAILKANKALNLGPIAFAVESEYASYLLLHDLLTCINSVALVIAVLVVPVAVSFLWYR